MKQYVRRKNKKKKKRFRFLTQIWSEDLEMSNRLVRIASFHRGDRKSSPIRHTKSGMILKTITQSIFSDRSITYLIRKVPTGAPTSRSSASCTLSIPWNHLLSICEKRETLTHPIRLLHGTLTGSLLGRRFPVVGNWGRGVQTTQWVSVRRAREPQPDSDASALSDQLRSEQRKSNRRRGRGRGRISVKAW